VTDILLPLRHMHRPRLLVQAATFALKDYRREPALRRLFGAQPIPGSCQAFLKLLSLEADCDTDRRSRSATYSAARHVDIMIALLGEAAEIGRASLPHAKASAVSDLRLAI
jgi:hypothetical protein